MYCIYCGKQLPDNARFCMNCGKALLVANEPAAAQEKPNHAVPSNVGQVLIRCNCCGGSDLKPVQRGVVRCESCGSKYRVDEQNRIESAEEVDAQLYAIFLEAAKYQIKDDYPNELQALAKGLPIAPDNALLMVKLGRVYRRLGMHNKALEYYRKAIALDPDDATTYSNIGILYLTLEQYAQAKPYLEQALSMVQANPLAATKNDQATLFGHYALCVGKLGDMRLAKEYLEKAERMGYGSEYLRDKQKQLGLIKK